MDLTLRLRYIVASHHELQNMAKKKKRTRTPRVAVVSRARNNMWLFEAPTIWKGSVEAFLQAAPRRGLFDLVVSSPPYNIGKSYEKTEAISSYLRTQKKVLQEIVDRLKPNGSLCWQVGNYVHADGILPLDIEYHKIFRKLGLKLKNRIIWRFGHGLHATRRFSGRYEVILWYTKSSDYTFNLDAVRIPAKYPAKRSYKGKKRGQYSSHPLGKNPEDVWDIPNVKGNHIEKTSHPCQFPVGLVERLVLALSNRNAIIFDPYAGVCSTGVAALLHGRRFIGCERAKKYCTIGRKRLAETLRGEIHYRSHNKPIYDHKKSKLSIPPDR